MIRAFRRWWRGRYVRCFICGHERLEHRGMALYSTTACKAWACGCVQFLAPLSQGQSS